MGLRCGSAILCMHCNKGRRVHMDAILLGLATLMLVVTPVLLILTVAER